MTLPIVISNTANLLGIMAIGFAIGSIPLLFIGFLFGRFAKPLSLSAWSKRKGKIELKNQIRILIAELDKKRAIIADYEAEKRANKILVDQMGKLAGRIK